LARRYRSRPAGVWPHRPVAGLFPPCDAGVPFTLQEGWTMTEAIPGYDYGTERAAFSPLDTEDLDKLKASVMFSADDEKALRQAGEVLDDQVSDVVGAWYDFIASQPHLVAAFSGPDGQVNEA